MYEGQEEQVAESKEGGEQRGKEVEVKRKEEGGVALYRQEGEEREQLY